MPLTARNYRSNKQSGPLTARITNYQDIEEIEERNKLYEERQRKALEQKNLNKINQSVVNTRYMTPRYMTPRGNMTSRGRNGMFHQRNFSTQDAPLPGKLNSSQFRTYAYNFEKSNAQNLDPQT